MRTALEKLLLAALLENDSEGFKIPPNEPAKENGNEPWKAIRKVGNKVLIRTVTHYYTGEITAVLGDALQLKDAAWIPDTGRFSEALKTGKFAEVEPYVGLVEVFTGATVEVCQWPHPLPVEKKP